MKIKFTDSISEYKSQKKYFHKSLDIVGKKGQYVLGDELKIFESNVKKFLKVKYVIGVGNWTEGMGLVCKALDLKKNGRTKILPKIFWPKKFWPNNFFAEMKRVAEKAANCFC